MSHTKSAGLPVASLDSGLLFLPANQKQEENKKLSVRRTDF